MPERVTYGGAERGYTLDKEAYRKRLARIEGQVRGVERMIEGDAYCIDVLTQISSVSSALRSVGLGLLDQHVRHCVMEAASGEDTGRADEMVAEATRAIERLVRS